MQELLGSDAWARRALRSAPDDGDLRLLAFQRRHFRGGHEKALPHHQYDNDQRDHRGQHHPRQPARRIAFGIARFQMVEMAFGADLFGHPHLVPQALLLGPSALA